MCHQSVGLIARAVEQRGIATLSMSSACSITRAVNPPRALYLDYPLGHTTGKPGEVDEQLAIMNAALDAFTTITTPGEIRHLPLQWQADHSWKERVMRPDSSTGQGDKRQPQDDRTTRHNQPQYQSESDAQNADPHCKSCVFLNISGSRP